MRGTLRTSKWQGVPGARRRAWFGAGLLAFSLVAAAAALALTLGA